MSHCCWSASTSSFTRDAFTYTHYPIRFNRRNRQVYVCRRDGTVLKAGWDDIYWTIRGHAVATKEGFVAGHVMADDGRTVQETFAPSKVVTVDAAGVQELKDHFEFFRRYMEEGPGPVLAAIKPVPLIMLPGIAPELPLPLAAGARPRRRAGHLCLRRRRPGRTPGAASDAGAGRAPRPEPPSRSPTTRCTTAATRSATAS